MYLHKEKTCADMICIWNYPDVTMLVQVWRCNSCYIKERLFLLFFFFFLKITDDDVNLCKGSKVKHEPSHKAMHFRLRLCRNCGFWPFFCD